MALRPVYSIQIFSLAPALPSQAVTVPGDARIIVRDIDAFEQSGAPSVALEILNAAGGLLWNVVTSSPWTPVNFQWRGRQVYNPGQTITLKVTGGAWAVQISGYELSLT